MTFDLTRFYQACNPNKTLDQSKAEDRQYLLIFPRYGVQKLLGNLEELLLYFLLKFPLVNYLQDILVVVNLRNYCD
jgi:hypothetical protein